MRDHGAEEASHLRAQVQRLEAENKALKEELGKLQSVVERAKEASRPMASIWRPRRCGQMLQPAGSCDLRVGHVGEHMP